MGRKWFRLLPREGGKEEGRGELINGQLSRGIIGLGGRKFMEIRAAADGAEAASKVVSHR